MPTEHAILSDVEIAPCTTGGFLTVGAQKLVRIREAVLDTLGGDRKRRVALFSCILLAIPLLVPTANVHAQEGKISGQVSERQTGESLPGVNVIIDGTTQGAVTDADGYYTILNVRPGTYTLRASFVGFRPHVVVDVRVNADLTTVQDFDLEAAAVGLEEVTVTASRPIVQPDVSANVANLRPDEMVDLPVAGISEVLDLQAGIEPGLQVRGGGLGELSYLVDGLNMRTGRSHEPFTGVSYTSLEEVQIQTGGFNAEYGNVRAGLINVTTKEPPRNRYLFDGLVRFAPPQDKAFNALVGLPDQCDYSSGDVVPDCNAYGVRPALDPAVSLVGTDAWDPYTQRQYKPFDGWNAVASRLRTQGFDVDTDDLVEYFKYTHRKEQTIEAPDYEADVTLGGPLIPGLSQKLGDLRFLASYRGAQTAYVLPQSRDAFDANTFQLKLISNVGRGMKLTLHGMRGIERGINTQHSSADVNVWKGNLAPYPWQQTGILTLEGIGQTAVYNLYTDGVVNHVNIDHTMLGGTFTHALSQRTFYEVTLQSMASKYRSEFPNLRDDSFVCPDSGVGPNGEQCDPGSFVQVFWTDENGNVYPGFEDKAACFGGTEDLTGDGELRSYCRGTHPLGYAGRFGSMLTGETTGGHWSQTRDTSDVDVLSGQFDLTSQVNRFLQVKTGAELNFSNYEMRYASVNLALVGPDPTQSVPYTANPVQGAAYAQSKLEFKGLIANLGVRLDYFDPNVEWWEFGSYDQALIGTKAALDELLSKQSIDSQLYVSPRAGVSFPITAHSKLYFNYGHFRQMLSPLQIFGINQTKAGGIEQIGDPTNPMPKTVAYELGFDQNIANLFLLRVSGFYRDLRQQPREVRFESLGATVQYAAFKPWNYEDIRGAEISLSKTRGKWLRGFFNYTYLQTKQGNFGYNRFFENSFDMRNYLRTRTDFKIQTPLAQPFARMNVVLLSPEDWGPNLGGFRPLGNLRASVLGEWRAGEKFTWFSGGAPPPELLENVSWRDYWNFDLRLTKHVTTGARSAQVFVDMSNVFNLQHLHRYTAFHSENQDWERYVQSLHLPEDVFDQLSGVDPNLPIAEKSGLPYFWVPGRDQPGDFRDHDVAFQPIEAVRGLDSVEPNEIAWYWDAQTGEYYSWTGGSWVEVPDRDVEKALDEKAYIDMPNNRFLSLLNPRRISLGLRITL